MLHHGMHLHKFGKWNVNQPAGPVDIGPTVNLLVPRDQVLAVGGFQAGWMIGDTLLGWKLKEHGFPIHFNPDAVVEHVYSSDAVSFVRERFYRGKEFSGLRTSEERWPVRRIVLWIVLTVLPVRLMLALRRSLLWFPKGLKHGMFWKAGVFGVAAAGTISHLAGEAAGFMHKLQANESVHSNE